MQTLSSKTTTSTHRQAFWSSACALGLPLLLVACGGSNGGGDAPVAEDPGFRTVAAAPVASSVANEPTSTLDANRLAHQASFGPTETLVRDIAARGAKKWVTEQMAFTGANLSRFSSGGLDDIHRYTVKDSDYCDSRGTHCWRDNYSAYPLLKDFYKNATTMPDQLRQRVAFALQQLLVISDNEVHGTYGHRRYHNMLLDGAFGNYRDLLRNVMASPVMGDFLDSANNDKASPNENFARELMQLFTIGLCELNTDGTLKGGTCTPTYDNTTVREYAHALTGWTYPDGGATAWGCWPRGLNCRYYAGEMKAVAAFHDTTERTLLSGVTVAEGSSAQDARERVLDSLMNHPNIGPFVARHLIQQLVMSNPKPAYVDRVVQAFNSGSFDGFGAGKKGDLSATVAAVLLDPEARRTTVERTDASLRQPALLFTGVVRALNGNTEGSFFSWWGSLLGQRVLSPPSVFSFFPPDYPVAGSALGLVGPAFGVHNAATAIDRMQYLNCAIQWDGCSSDTQVNLQSFIDQYISDGAPGAVAAPRTLADDKVIDRLSILAYGQTLPADERSAILEAMDTPWTNQTYRVKQAAWLVFASPRYQMVH
jgi:uncharacterized protein (DUF1800 family)